MKNKSKKDAVQECNAVANEMDNSIAMYSQEEATDHEGIAGQDGSLYVPSMFHAFICYYY